MDRPEADAESRTEEATERRIVDALDEGNTPATPEAAVLATMVAGAVAASALLVPVAQRISSDLTAVLEGIGGRSLAVPADTAALAAEAFGGAAGGLAAIIALFAAAGLTTAALQGHVRLAAKRVEPRLDNVSAVRGFSRILGRRALLQLGKSLVKLAIVGSVGGWMIWRDVTRYEALITTDTSALAVEMVRGGTALFAALALLAAVVFAFDLALARFLWRRGLRMTREEVSRDMRETEGEPLLKARRLAIARGRARRRTLAAVPRATMVIANPTHYAVALRYVHGQERAPEVVAKGLDIVALAIRRTAEEHRIPVIEDKVLARSLYSRVEVDQQIPPEFYRAIASIVATLQRRKLGPIERGH